MNDLNTPEKAIEAVIAYAREVDEPRTREFAKRLRSRIPAPDPQPERMAFPLLGGQGFIPWALAEEAYAVYAKRYGTDQSLARLAERGGFGANELDDMLPGWRERLPPPQPSERAGEPTEAVIEAARFVWESLRDGFVRCQNCSEQETTSDMDGVQSLGCALDAYDAARKAAGEFLVEVWRSDDAQEKHLFRKHDQRGWAYVIGWNPALFSDWDIRVLLRSRGIEWPE